MPVNVLPWEFPVCVQEILRYAQDDSPGTCHPERSEGSLALFDLADLILRCQPYFLCNRQSSSLARMTHPNFTAETRWYMLVHTLD